MRVAILYPQLAADAALEDQDSLVQVEAIAAALARLGHETMPVACDLDLAALRSQLEAVAPDVVFNLAESLGGADSLQYVPPALLDTLDVPYTGAPTEAIFQTTHKLLAKQLLHLAGLPTPGWLAWNGRQMNVDAATLAPPYIVKAVWEHASRGLDDDNVVTDAAALVPRLRQHAARWRRPCFAEQYIAGREFNLALLTGPNGVEPLPPAEIDFSAFPPGKPHIVGHRAKWEDQSFEFHNTPRRFDFAAEDAPLLACLRELATRCWNVFGLAGYARVDFRVDAQARPWILEINTNPCLSPDAGFAAALARAGISFETAIQRILAAATDREGT
jgi:D-alanine-D-alanine ligase